MDLKKYEKIARNIADMIDDLLTSEEGEEGKFLGRHFPYEEIGPVEVLRTNYFKEERRWQIRIYFHGEDYEFVLIRKYLIPTDEEFQMDYAERVDNSQYYLDVLNLLINFRVK